MLKTHRERHLLHTERETVALCRSQTVCQRVARRSCSSCFVYRSSLVVFAPTGRARAIGIFQLSAICNLWHSQCRLGPSARSRIVTVYPASSRNCLSKKSQAAKEPHTKKQQKKKTKTTKRKEMQKIKRNKSEYSINHIIKIQ